MLTIDEHLLLNNDIYKSCESESSHSLYLSPNSSLIDSQNMAQELDEMNTHSNVLFDPGKLICSHFLFSFVADLDQII